MFRSQPILGYVLLLLFSQVLLAQDFRSFPTAADDGVQWKFEQPSRVVTVGDIHADPDALLNILQNQKVIDSNGRWIAGDAHVVFIGDILDRGPDSRFCLDFIQRLSQQAQGQRGKVHTLLGNHETLALVEGYPRYVTDRDAREYLDFGPPVDSQQIEQNLQRRRENRGKVTPEDRKEIIEREADGRARVAFMAAQADPNSRYAQELRARNSIIQIGDTLYVHAGVGDFLLDAPPEQIGRLNATIRKQISAWQDYRAKIGPEPSSHWTMTQRGNGPHWTRDMASGTYPLEKLLRIAKALGVKRVVFGHTPTKSKKIETSYGGLAFNVDTSVSVGYGGELTALEILSGGKAVPHDEIPRGENPLKAVLDEEFKKQRGPLPAPYAPKPSGFGAFCKWFFGKGTTP